MTVCNSPVISHLFHNDASGLRLLEMHNEEIKISLDLFILDCYFLSQTFTHIRLIQNCHLASQ